MSRPLLHFQPGHEVHLLQGSHEFFPALCRAIAAATHRVWLETYIFDLEGQAQTVAEALVRAARRGVQVRLLVDGVGTGALPEPWAGRFRDAGVVCRIYSPLGPLGWLDPTRWRRLHRKLCVVDGEWLFCGGINIVDDWHDPVHGALAQPRFDLALSARGPIVAEGAQTMGQLWWRLQLSQAARERRLPAVLEAWRQRRATASAAWEAATPGRGVKAALALRDNLHHRSRIEKAYLRAIGTAREEVLIANAYFLPGRRLRRALVLAARRGVKVRLLLQGRYESFMQFHAARPVYGALLDAGVEIHEYAPSFLHAKVAVVDRHWSTVGSSNLDPLSLLLAREANVVVEDRAFAERLRRPLLQAMAQAGRPLEAEALRRRPWSQRLLDRLAFALMRLALLLNRKHY